MAAMIEQVIHEISMSDRIRDLEESIAHAISLMSEYKEKYLDFDGITVQDFDHIYNHLNGTLMGISKDEIS